MTMLALKLSDADRSFRAAFEAYTVAPPEPDLAPIPQKAGQGASTRAA